MSLLVDGIWGVETFSGSTKGMTLKILPDVGIYKWAQNRKNNYDITCLVCELRKTEFLEMHFLRMLTSRYFAGLSILTSDIDPENFRLISPRLVILENNL